MLQAAAGLAPGQHVAGVVSTPRAVRSLCGPLQCEPV